MRTEIVELGDNHKAGPTMRATWLDFAPDQAVCINPYGSILETSMKPVTRKRKFIS